MLKTISAALLAVSVIAAPALAASSTDQAPANKTAQAPASKTDKATVGKTTQTPAAKTTQVKPKALNANAKMGHHAKHYRSHKNMSSLKTHKVSKVSIKHV